MIANIERYLKENIDSHMTIKPWMMKSDFSIFLRNIYNFYVMKIIGTQCLLLEVLDELPGIDQLQKHIGQINKITEYQVVLYYKQITKYRRKSLIENRIAFVVEDGQMYLPFLGLDLKKTNTIHEKELKVFTAATQIAYIFFLYHKDEVVNVTEFSEKMNFNKMTASRALNDLYEAKLVNYVIGGKTGRSKEYRRISDPDYFIRGREYLKSPVNKIIHVKDKPLDWLKSGLEALSDLSMINPPSHSVIAVDKKQFNHSEFEEIMDEDMIKDMKLVEIQLWDYDPKLFANKGRVDLLSLFASLKDIKDDRVEQALEEALGGEAWYMD